MSTFDVFRRKSLCVCENRRCFFIFFCLRSPPPLSSHPLAAWFHQHVLQHFLRETWQVLSSVGFICVQINYNNFFFCSDVLLRFDQGTLEGVEIGMKELENSVNKKGRECFEEEFSVLKRWKLISHADAERERERINRGIWCIIINTHCVCVGVCVCMGGLFLISRWLTETWLLGTQSQREESRQKASFLLEPDCMCACALVCVSVCSTSAKTAHVCVCVSDLEEGGSVGMRSPFPPFSPLHPPLRLPPG